MISQPSCFNRPLLERLRDTRAMIDARTELMIAGVLITDAVQSRIEYVASKKLPGGVEKAH